MDRHPGILLGLLIASASVACSSSSAPAGLGARRTTTAARALVASADGAWLAYLDGCVEARAQSLPAGTANCDLRVVPAAGGEPVLVAKAVSTLPGAVIVSPVGAELAALGGYDYATAAGTLVRWRAGAGVRELAGGVTFHGYGADGALGYIAGGTLFLAPAGGDAAQVPEVTSAASFELAPQGMPLAALVRRKASAGGELLALDRGGGAPRAPQAVARPVGDYAFGRTRFAFTRLEKDGAELQLAEGRASPRPEVVARSVRAFAFQPDGDAVAFLAEATPGKQGNLRVRAAGGEVALGKDVGEFRWAAKAPRLAWIEEYDPRVRSGTLAVGGLTLGRRALGKNVSDLELSADGKFVAYLQHTTQGGYTVELLLAALDAPATAAPRRVAQGSYGFAFSPDSRWLYYRTRCTRSGEACDLERIDASAADGKPEIIGEGIKSFEFDPRDAGRLLITWKRLDRDALDLAVWQGSKLVTVDTYVLAGSARFLPTPPVRVAYAVVQEKRWGVYVAEVPAVPQAP